MGSTELEHLANPEFKCLCGVSRGTFGKMVAVLRPHLEQQGRRVKKVEDLLVKCGQLRLPSQRQLYPPDWEWKVMMVDVGAMAIERPQTNRNAMPVASNGATR